MKLIKARLRGLEPSTASQWFELDPGLNFFAFSKPEHGTSFLRILQTLNPPYKPEATEPYADFPAIEKIGGYSRRINPAKRTIALGVFEATANLVGELSLLSDLLFEVDRVEVGRRLDYSRWINFVEVASSTRWSEISPNVKKLIDGAANLCPGSEKALLQLTASLQPTDRLVDEIADTLLHHLEELPLQLREDLANLLGTVQNGIRRAEYFRAAREIICRRMPLFVVIDCPGAPGKMSPTVAQPVHNQHPASCDNLLKLTKEHLEKTGQQGAEDKDLILNRIERHLHALQPPDMKLSLESAATGKLFLKNRGQLCTTAGGPKSLLQHLQATTCLAAAISRELYKTEPILMFNQPETGLPKILHGELTDFIISFSRFCQCFYGCTPSEMMEKDLPGRKYSLEELGMVV